MSLIRQLAALAAVIVGALQANNVIPVHWLWILAVAGAVILWLENPANIPVLGGKIKAARQAKIQNRSAMAGSQVAPPLG